jgi:predicted component of type VI protein secretion system
MSPHDGRAETGEDSMDLERKSSVRDDLETLLGTRAPFSKRRLAEIEGAVPNYKQYS